MRTLSVAVATLLYSTLFSAPLLAEQHQTHTMTSDMSGMNGMSHSMSGEMNHNGMSSSPSESSTVYHSSGIIKQWNASGVTLAHAAIPALRWPAMTMTFRLPANDNRAPLPLGSTASFSFVQSADGYTLTDITPQQN
ncbi:copper-binding protein [Dickeya dadantii]|uniref:copper-binding protein n=1 Tax=Dickeya dadantii TaxID=204038 RepID=UPI001495CB72|nr:copper-binding protein [Dickeya dadantii]NPE59593.1 copper-binding protein [Dickeya dadantii]NPE69519.1 copper-binding protein [Dickeya dadantii]